MARHGISCLVLLLTLGLVACGGEETRQSPTLTTGSPSPTSTVTLADIEAIEDAVRAYFEAFRTNDTEARQQLSVGEVRALAEWPRIILGGNPPSEATLEIESLRVEEVEGGEATVDFAARFTEEFTDPQFAGESYSIEFSGPVLLEQENGVWKVSDYQRNGRSQAEGIFTNVRGQQERNGVILKAFGVDLRSETIVVMLIIRNTRDESVNAFVDLQLVDDRGEQYSNPSLGPTDVAPGARLRTYISWPDQNAPLDTTSLRLLIDFFGESSNETIPFDLKIGLID